MATGKALVTAVRCSKCGEELLGAVNRCWKCGQAYALPPEKDGRPPVRAAAMVSANEPLEAVVVGEATSLPNGVVGATPAPLPVAIPRVIQPRPRSATELIDARRAGIMAMGGTVASLVLGVFAAILSAIWPPAALIAVLGLIMGIWGLSSPRRNWALVGMLLCCLAIGLGSFGVAKGIYLEVKNRKALTIDEPAADVEP
jgi:hypothetical protein